MAQTIVILGASGDLTSRKLIPALYWLHAKKRLPAETRIVGVLADPVHARRLARPLGRVDAAVRRPQFDAAAWSSLAPNIYYFAANVGEPGEMCRLGDFLKQIEGSQPLTRIYYLAMAPQLYEAAVANLGVACMAAEASGPRRLVVEKPFGADLASAERLNAKIHEVFAESQVYRIDHYLGKETVQNVLVLRFANTIFEPVWNRNYIAHVEITAAEELTVGHRAGFYDSAGVLRDMFQGHLLQLLTLTAMETPVRNRGRRRPRREGQSLAGDPARWPPTLPPTRCGVSTGLSPGAGRTGPKRYGHLRRGQAARRQLALAGRAVLSPQRQGMSLPDHAIGDPIPPAAAHALRRRASIAGRSRIAS